MLTIAPKNFVGVQSVFKNLENLGLSKNVYLEDVKLPVDDHILLGSWHPTYPLIIRHVPAHLTYSFLWTSSLYEAEVMGEIDNLFMILNNTKPAFVWCGKKSVAELIKTMLPDIDIPIIHCSYPLYEVDNSSYEKMIDKRKNCGFFCPSTLKKNIYTNVAGWIISNKKQKSKLFTNVQGVRGHNVINVPWMSRDEYDTLISTLRLGLQVDISSSFNYVAYDFLIRGIPCLISPSISNNMGIYIDDITVRDIDDAIEVSDKICNILSLGDDEYKVLSSRCKNNASNLYRLAKENVLNVLTEMFSNISK